MFRSGRSCTRSGVYRSDDCGYEATVMEGEPFPECPVHDKAVTWTFVRNVRKPKRPV